MDTLSQGSVWEVLNCAVVLYLSVIYLVFQLGKKVMSAKECAATLWILAVVLSIALEEVCCKIGVDQFTLLNQK